MLHTFSKLYWTFSIHVILLFHPLCPTIDIL
nr:MAG TPA: hypothetical protein [Bacteriophage sp.]DAR39726.1 MAG TPA: hypothetical protein [Caudoviricetes sp.]